MAINTSALWLLTGPRGAGKTTFCSILACHARLDGWDVAGVISPAVMAGSEKTGILVEDLRTGEQHPLASASLRKPFSMQLKDWHFDPLALSWGNRILENCTPCDLLIVDELGPLELLRNEGWTSALKILDQHGYRLGIAVVRPELQDILSKSLTIAGTIFIDRPTDLAAEANRWWERLSGSEK